MEDLRASKKGRRRSLRNIRRSSSNFMPASGPCLEPAALEDANCADVSSIINSYGSAWLGVDENTDPLKILNSASIVEQEKARCLSDSSRKNFGENHFDVLQPLAENQDIVESPVKNLATDVADSPLCGEPGGNWGSLTCSVSVSGPQHGSTSSESDSLPELDLSMYGPVADCLGNHTSRFNEIQDHLLTSKVCKSLELNGFSPRETFENLNGSETKILISSFEDAETLNNNTKKGVNDLNDAFVDCNHDLLKSDETEYHTNERSSLDKDSFNSVDLSGKPSPNDVEMQPLCKNESAKETCLVPSPKIRKVSVQDEPSHGLLGLRDSGKSFENRSLNRNSSNQGMSMLSAIQSLTLELEALSAISDSQENCTAKLTQNTDESEHKVELKIVDSAELFSWKDLSKVPSRKRADRKRLSLNRRSSSAADNEGKQGNVSPLKSVSDSCVETNVSFISKPSSVNVYSEEKLKLETHSHDSVPEFQTDSCSAVLGESLAETVCGSTFTQVDDKVSGTQTSELAASELKLEGLEEARLLEELSLRFPNDSASPKTKTCKNKVSSRRRSSRWLNLPTSDLDVGHNGPADLGNCEPSGDPVLVCELSDDPVLVSSQNPQNSAETVGFEEGASAADLQHCQSNLVESSERLESEEQANAIQCSSQSTETLGEPRACKRRGRKPRRRSAPATIRFDAIDESDLKMNVDTLASEISDVLASVRSEEINQIMEDLPMSTSLSLPEIESAKPAQWPAEEMDITLNNQGDISAEYFQPPEVGDGDVRPLRRSTRSQTTCKRKSWVLPTAGETASSSYNMHTTGGSNSKLAGNSDLSGGVTEQLEVAMDESEVDEALRLIYLNKMYEAPPPTRPWETIKEHPMSNKDTFSCRRQPRLLNFQEKISHTKWMKRYRKASLLHAKSLNKPVNISEEEFEFRMGVLDRMLSS